MDECKPLKRGPPLTSSSSRGARWAPIRVAAAVAVTVAVAAVAAAAAAAVAVAASVAVAVAAVAAAAAAVAVGPGRCCPPFHPTSIMNPRFVSETASS